ncbi:helix-turn-helix domain-containing protein [Microbacterium testaceum]|uniref:helix-turn-helix domain-containing protein n=1 Tax=Microbacterium testaceum TaxID=2033 RepID=UPI002AC7D24C|nr:helix-turn-helix domain-containing protein [Microbacterium testaceum]MDZ5143513.1 helix-turn-helix domain-containing protein [Microbacterium testaceum]
MSPVAVSSVAEWTRACSGAFVPLRVHTAAPAFRASLAQVRLGPSVTVTRVTSEALTVFRDVDLIRSQPRDDVLISLHRRGRGMIRQHGRSAVLGCGSAVMYDAASPYALSFPGTMSEVVLQLPRRTLTSTGHTFAGLTAVELPDSAQLRALTMLAASVEQPAGDEAEAIGEALVGLLRAVVRAHDNAPPPAEPRLLAEGIRLWIGEHASDPELTPERVAAHFHIAVRTLQKLFAAEGESPAAFIRGCRLRRSRTLLVGGASVNEAARRSGYLDLDSFTRAFKREFGHTPSSVRALGA